MAKENLEKCKEKYAGPKRMFPKGMHLDDNKSMRIETPYPKSEVSGKYDVENELDFLGNKCSSIDKRLNEMELSIESLTIKIGRALGRLGLE